MRETNIDWIPNIPDNWDVVRLKDIAKLQSGEGITSDFIDETGDYPVYGGNGLRGYTDIYTNDGDYVLIGRQGALCGNINYAKGKFYASEHAVVVYTHDKHENTTWLGETLRMANFNRLSASAAQPGLSVSVLNYQKIPYPPKEVRQRIGLYLDEKLSEIDKRVSVLEKQCDAYTRLKKSIIHQAVTRGLNPNVPLKDSGIEWIGMIPEHWEELHLKNCVYINNGSDYKEIEVDDGYPVIGSGGIFAYASEKMYEGEVILLGRKGTIDKPLYYNGAFWSVDTMFYAIPKKNSYCKYLYYCATRFPFGKISTATALPSMTQKELYQLPIMLPPLQEQQAIATYLDEKCAKIDAAVENIGKQIEASKRLKRAIINEAISGKTTL